MGDFEDRSGKINLSQVKMILSIYKKCIPMGKDVVGNRIPLIHEFDWRKFQSLVNKYQEKYGIADIITYVGEKAGGYSGNAKSVRRQWVQSQLGFWKNWEPQHMGFAGSSLALTKEGIEHRDFTRSHEIVGNLWGRLEMQYRDYTGASIRRPESVSEYGANNDEEDYAEAFAHFILNKPMPQGIYDLFMEVNGFRKASFRSGLISNERLAKELLKISKELNWRDS